MPLAPGQWKRNLLVGISLLAFPMTSLEFPVLSVSPQTCVNPQLASVANFRKNYLFEEEVAIRPALQKGYTRLRDMRGSVITLMALMAFFTAL
jgi:hypothetical protein